MGGKPLAASARDSLAAMDDDSVATSLRLETPAQATPYGTITLTGTYTGTPHALDYNFGSGWIEASSVDYDNGSFSFSVAGGLAAGSYLMPEIRDHSATSVTAASSTFIVSGWTPETLATSPGAAAVFEFNANDPDDIVTAADGSVVRVLNPLDKAQYLTVRTGSDNNPVTIADNSGSDGTRRVLQFNATKISSNIADPTTNWLEAGSTAGSALVNLANSTNLSKDGSFTTILALKIDTAYSYEAGPIWGTLAEPGPLQYVQLRVNGNSGYQGANLAPQSGAATNAQDTITAGWHVMTMIKDGGLLSYRLDGVLVKTSTITSTAAFTAGDFMIGGGYPAGSEADLSQENGVPPPDVGDFQAYSGVLAGNDLTQAEALAAGSIGVPLGTGSRDVYLGAEGTVYAAVSGDVVHAGTGAATVTAVAGSVTMYGSGGPLLFLGGSGSSTVTGGSGGVTVQGGSGGGVFTGGSAGDGVLVSSGGNTTLTGGGNGDRLFGSAGQIVMTAGSGRESLIGGSGNTTITGGTTAAGVIFTGGNTTVSGGAAGGDTVVGGAGSLTMNIRSDAVFAGTGATAVDGGTSGADSIIGGSGTLNVTGHGDNMIVVGGTGSSTINTGNGANTVFTESGAMTLNEGSGPATILLGSGSSRINEGTGTLTYDLVKGAAGGLDVISGYRPGNDRIALFGYGAEQFGVTSGGGNAVLSLSDGTRITLLGVGDPGTILTA